MQKYMKSLKQYFQMQFSQKWKDNLITMQL
jgi:hypothetical protein